jgi:hypothetical protein
VRAYTAQWMSSDSRPSFAVRAKLPAAFLVTMLKCFAGIVFGHASPGASYMSHSLHSITCLLLVGTVRMMRVAATCNVCTAFLFMFDRRKDSDAVVTAISSCCAPQSKAYLVLCGQGCEYTPQRCVALLSGFRPKVGKLISCKTMGMHCLCSRSG